MIDLSQFNKEQLLDPANFEKVYRETQAIIDQASTRGAWNSAKALFQKLELDKSRELSEIEKKYVDLISGLHWTALPIIPDEKIKNLFKKRLLNAFSQNLNIVKRLKVKLISLSLSERNEFKKGLIEALHQNIQTVGRRPIAEWLKDYDALFGREKVEKEKIKEHLKTNPQITALGADDQRNLKSLFTLYESLKTTALSLDNLEENILVRDKKGEFMTLKKDKAKATIPETAGKPLNELKEEARRKISTPPQVTAPLPKAKAEYYFDAEDQEEIKGFGDKVKELRPVGPLDYELIAQRIIQNLGLNFSEEALKKRLESLINSRLRDIRSIVQLKQMLMRSDKNGGMGYGEDQVNQIIPQVEAEVKKIHDLKTQELEKKPEAPKTAKTPVPLKAIEAKEGSQTLETIKDQLKKKMPEKEEVKFSSGESVEDGKEEIKAEKPLPKIPPTLPVKEPRISEPKPQPEPKPKLKPKPKYQKLPVKRPEIVSQKKVADIKKPAKPVGPVGELKEMNLTDFRRLGDSVTEAIKKIVEKISLLEEESLAKRAQGIKAWLSSGVCRLYLDIGRESMSSSKNIEEVINDRVAGSRPYLTLEEFNSIADLNSSLRI